MLHFIHKWLYERSQRNEAFKLPKNEPGKIGLGFGDYVANQSKIGSLGAYDLLHRRKRRVKWFLGAVALAILIWLGWELVYAVRFYSA